MKADRYCEIILVLLILTFIGWFSFVVNSQYLALEDGWSVDNASNIQTIYNSSQGRLMRQSVLYDGVQNHAKFFSLFYAFVYKFFPNYLTIAILKVALIGLAAFPLYLISLHVGNSKSISLLFSVVFLISPMVIGLTIGNFKPVVSAISLLMFCILFYLKDNRVCLFLFIILSLMVKEIVGYIGILFCVVLAVEKRWQLLVPLGFILGCYFLFIHMFYFKLIDIGNYVNLHRSVPTDYEKMFVQYKRSLTAWYVKVRQLFSGITSFSLFYPQMLFFTLPCVVIILLTWEKDTWGHYVATAVPFVFAAMAIGYNTIAKKFNHVSYIAAFLVCFNVIGFWKGIDSYRPVSVSQKAEAAWELIEMVEPNASVACDPYVMLPLSFREKVYSFGRAPYYYDNRDYFAVDYILIDPTKLHRYKNRDLFKFKQNVEELKKRTDFKLVAESEPWQLYKKI